MNRLSVILKSSRFLYTVYFICISAILRILGFFIRCDHRLILFSSFGGKKYDDSPKAVYECMLSDKRYDEYKLVWALQNPSTVSIPGRGTIIKMDSFQYFVIALKASIWVTNSSMERGLSFKKTNTLCFNSWHGSPIKAMGIDLGDKNQSFRGRVLVRADIMLAQSQYDINAFSHAFRLPKSRFEMIGLPRNDVLASYTMEDVVRIKKKLGIDMDKSVILYAPTYREYTKGKNKGISLEIPINPDYWQKLLGEKYVVLFRAHYEVAQYMKLNDWSVFIDMSTYPNLNELMIISDALISDYSSVIIDYSIMHKPIYCFAFDYEEYVANRGLYLNLDEELPCIIHHNEDSLLHDILDGDHDGRKKERVSLFQQKYVSQFGQAAIKSCDLIYTRLVEKESEVE